MLVLLMCLLRAVMSTSRSFLLLAPVRVDSLLVFTS
jgi:hypothetical protein